MSQASSTVDNNAVAADASAGAGVWRARVIAAVVLAACLTLLGVAVALEPDPQGFGTHESMGLPPCGFKAATELPCATCGMTTSFTHAANGDLLTAFTVQPAGTVLALITAMLAVVSALSLALGFSMAPLGRVLGRPMGVAAFGALLLAGWAYTLATAVGFSL